MNTAKFKSMLAETVVAPMLAYLEECGADCMFKKQDVQACERILLRYLDSLEKLSAPSDQAILACVEKAVLDLNKLNEKTDYALLETEERENICEWMQTAAVACGLSDDVDDVTGEWREW
jgi:hypothetical protein